MTQNAEAWLNYSSLEAEAGESLKFDVSLGYKNKRREKVSIAVTNDCKRKWAN